MPSLFLLDPPPSPRWFPFSDSRPICELKAGAFSIRERWEGTLDAVTTGIFAPAHLHRFTEDDVPAARDAEPVTGPAWVVQSDFAPSGEPVDPPDETVCLTNDDEAVGWWVSEGDTWTPDQPSDTATGIPVDGMRLHGAFDLVTALEMFLEGDAAGYTGDGVQEIPDETIVIGHPENVVLMGAMVEPGVVFDVRAGPVIIDQDTYVRSGTRFEGPVVIGTDAVILGGEIKRSVIGARSKVRGEVESTLFLGYANKGHDGFVGHSVVGRWVNLGAGTTTSNLKNTYGPVRLAHPDEPIETGRQFLGTLFGDHAKTAIGSMFPTGASVGTGANVFGGSIPKFLPPFAWGTERAERMNRDGFLTVAERVMPRRDVEFSSEVRDMLSDIYAHTVG